MKRDYRPTPQPTPTFVEDGDCGACVLSGLTELSVGEIYRDHQPCEQPRMYTRSLMRKSLRSLKRSGHIDNYIVDTPVWLPYKPHEMMNWGLPVGNMSRPWWRYLKMAMEAGYVGAVSVRLKGDGRLTDDEKYRKPNHFAMLVGVRDDYEVLLRCSSTQTPDEQWLESDSFLRDYGGFNTILVRP